MMKSITPLLFHVDISKYSLVEIDNCNVILGKICDIVLNSLKVNPLMLCADCSLRIAADHLEYLFDIINEGRSDYEVPYGSKQINKDTQILRYDIYRPANETNVCIEFISDDRIVLSFDFNDENYFFLFDDRFACIAEFSKAFQAIKARAPDKHKPRYNVFPYVIDLRIFERMP